MEPNITIQNNYNINIFNVTHVRKKSSVKEKVSEAVSGVSLSPKTEKPASPKKKRISKETFKKSMETNNKIKNLMDEKFDKAQLKQSTGHFKKASKYYNDVISVNDTHPDLLKGLLKNSFKNLYLCQMELWNKKKKTNAKGDLIFEAEASLNKYLANETSFKEKISFHADFATQVFDYGLSLVANDCFSAFIYFKLLLIFDLEHKNLIYPSQFEDIISDILHNMTCCISNQEHIEKGSASLMQDHMKSLVMELPLSKENQDFYHNWLSKPWDETLEEQMEARMNFIEGMEDGTKRQSLITIDKVDIAITLSSDESDISECLEVNYTIDEELIIETKKRPLDNVSLLYGINDQNKKHRAS